MASHHHHCHPSSTAAAAAPCYCHCCQPTHTPCHHHHHPPPPPDPHLYLHHSPHPPHLYSLHSHPYPQNSPHHFQENYTQERTPDDPTVSSLLRRIAALESALRRRSSPFQSLRDAAARSIQAHFRAFLVRRSITLRHLKDLAAIKTSLGLLKSSISEKNHFDYDVVYHKAANLLLKLDAIQGGDPMIRSGKSSLSREVYRFLDFIERACVQRRTIAVDVRQSGNNVRSRVSTSENKIGSVESGCSKRVNMEKLRGLVERIDRLADKLDEEQGQEIKTPTDEFVMRKYGVSATPTGGLLKQDGGVGPRVKKNVTFAENGKVYRVLRRGSQPYLEECGNGSIDKDDLDDDDGNEKELEDDDLSCELEEMGVSAKEGVEDEAEYCSSSSEGEKGSRHSSVRRGNFGTRGDQDGIGGSVFSAPLPAKMERRSN